MQTSVAFGVPRGKDPLFIVVPMYEPCLRNPKPKILNSKLKTLNSQPLVLHDKTQTLNPQIATRNPEPLTLNIKLETLNSKP